ncbi:MAG: hypothetical protein HOO86_15245 [Bacteroidales bacterium]|nr:hypothetical protein [Bacteroidales bacterium]
MNEQHKIDEILRNSLEGYKPDLNARQRSRFLEEAAKIETPTTGNNNRRNKLIAGGLLLIAFTTGLLFIFNPDVDSPVERVAKSLAPEIITSAVNEIKVLNEEKVGQNIPVKEIGNGSEKIEISAKTRNNFEVAETIISTDNSDKQTETVEKQIPPTGVTTFENTITNTDATNNTEVVVIAALPEEVQLISEVPVNKETEQTEKDVPARKPSQNRNQSALVNVYYRPEMIYNIIGNEKLMQSFGAEFQYKLFDNKYIIGTGLGLSISNGYYEYAIDYNEYLGTFDKLDSISFDFDAQRFEMTQTVHTSEEVVFDTATQTEYARIYRQFVYLQIPFMIGYDFIRKENFSLGVRFSPILSILLTNKPIYFHYDAGFNQIIQINRITPERVHTNWQLTTGFNFTRYTKSRLFFEIEPRFTYYFNSVYQKSDHTNPPYGFGIRLGIGIR